MDRASVLGDEVSIRVEELLIISTVEAIAVDADRISVPQLEPYALWLTRNTTRCPSYVEELDAFAFCMSPSPHTYPWGKVGGFDF
jgi:hypothetical protein